MNIQYSPNKNYQFHAFLLFFIISNSQIGVGLFNFERYVFQAAGHDAWISVVIAAVGTHLLTWMNTRMLEKYDSTDYFGIHFDLFGKWIGSILASFYLVYLTFAVGTILINYVEVVQAWIFPDFPSWLLVSILLLLTIYAGFGGIRVIIGMTVLGFVAILVTAVLFYYPVKYAVWSQLLPIMETEPMKVMNGALRMSFTLAGAEILLFLYPFIRNKQKTMLYSQFSVLFSNMVYLIIMMIAIIYFSPCQLRRAIWPSINLLKIIKFSYLERLEFIVVSVWILIALTGLLLHMWVISHGCKRLWKWNQKLVMVGISILVLFISLFIDEHKQIEIVNQWVGKSSVVFSYLYPTLLFFVTWIVFAFRKRKQLKKEGGQS